MRIGAETAWERVLGNDRARWTADLGRLRRDFVETSHRPKFRLAAEDSFFCIGSCFARSIEEHLLFRGARVLSKRMVSPREEHPYRVTGIVNKYTTASMLNEVRWVGEPPAAEALLLESERGWVDLQLNPSQRPVPLARALERRAYLSRDYFARLRRASVVIVTLGLVETWWDDATGLYLNGSPSLWQVRRQPGRFQFERLDAAANLALLRLLRERIAQLSPGAKIVVTVSPVPLATTFTAEDVLVANSYSKSALRAAAQELADGDADVDYFPSYELAMCSRRDATFSARDCCHVQEDLVGHIVAQFLSTYVGELPHRHPGFHELLYLAANPDVEEEVRRGELESGFEHYCAAGRREERPLRPATVPDWLLELGVS